MPTHLSPTHLAAATGLCAISWASGCLDRPIAPIDPRTTSTLFGGLEQNAVERIDIVLAIDNSSSMADKQKVLAKAVPVLVKRLVQPRCVTIEGAPTGDFVDAEGKCAAGARPEFPPIKDINVGILSSSLGDLGTGRCAGSVDDPNDGGRLVVRGVEAAETFESKGFLAWDPEQKRGGIADVEEFSRLLGLMVEGVGEQGCGYEMQLESIVRFLVDPAPYASLTEEGDYLRKVDVDQGVLTDRKNFLRPDSLVAVLVLSDENDCSFDLSRQGHKLLPASSTQGFYRSTSECETDPESACCASCFSIPPGCDAGDACKTPRYTTDEDSVNLKCWDQKRRFGVDFLYPVERYRNAFTQRKIDPNASDFAVTDESKAVDNPLFVSEDGVRSSDLVYVAGIVGVPWQAIARRDAEGQPDLELGFQSGDELGEDLAKLVGSPDAHVRPTDPFLFEDWEPRSGSSDLVGHSLPGANPINGGDFSITENGAHNLQHTCIFSLPEPITDGGDCASCDGPNPSDACGSALCDGTTQVAAKAYPSLRELSLLSSLGDQGIFASICPSDLGAPEENPAFGYNPAVSSIIDRLKEKLQGECFSRDLEVDPNTGLVSCIVVEAYTKPDCSCDAESGRAQIPETLDGAPNPRYEAVRLAQEDEFAADYQCFCEILPVVEAAERDACLEDLDPVSAAQGDGWCYVDANAVPPVGNEALVAQCPAAEKRLMRFVGEGDPRPGTDVYVTCAGK
jgi:hypothetical protein